MRRRDFIIGASAWLAACEGESDVPYAVKKTSNLAYGNDALNKIDQYVPLGAKGRVGAVLFIPGGTFTACTVKEKTSHDPYCKEIAKLGYCAFVLSYRGLPSNVYVDTMADVRAATDWVKGRSFVNPGKVCVWGSSAGAFMAAWMASEARASCMVGQFGPYNLDSDAAQAKVGAWFGAVDRHTLSPQFAVTSGHKPAFLMHGTEDKTVAYQSSVDYKAALDAVGVPASLRLYSGGHGLPSGSTYTKMWNDQMAFLKKYIG